VAQGAPHSAVAHLRRALAEPPDAAVRGHVLLDLGFAESYVGDPEAPRHLDSALDAATDRTAQVAATLALGRMIQLSGRHGDAFALYDRTAKRIGSEDPRAALVLEGALVSAAQLDPTTADRAAERIGGLRARAEAEPDPPPTIFGRIAVAAVAGNEPADVGAALARRPLTAGLRIFPEAADRPPFFYHCVCALMFAERCDEAAAYIDDQLAEAQRFGAVQHVVGLAATSAWLRWRTGSLAEAEADASLALTAGGVASGGFFGCAAVAVRTACAAERGDLDRALAAVEEAAPWPAPRAFTHALLAEAHAQVLLARGDAAGAAERALQAGEDLRALHATTPALPHGGRPRRLRWPSGATAGAPLRSPARSSRSRARSGRRARPASRCGRRGCSTATSKCSAPPRRRWSRPMPASTTRARCASWARRCDVPTAVPTRALRSARRSISPIAAVRPRSPSAPTPSCWPPARDRGASS
jgi:hypothetical protein